MKTIEERIKEVSNRWWDRPAWKKSMLIAALSDIATELAADLNAEKEKEVAELRAWKESALKVMPDFQKLGKLLGLPLGSSVSEQLVPAVEKLTKEVAELMEKLAAIEAGSYIQNLSVSSHFELDCGPIKTEPALLDEVKRVLGEMDDAASVLFWTSEDGKTLRDGTPEDSEAPEGFCKAWTNVRQLLTRLGGSHE